MPRLLAGGPSWPPWGCHPPSGGDPAGVTVAFGGLSLEAALEDGELLPEPAHTPQLGSLLRRQQLLHLLHRPECLLLAQALLGGDARTPPSPAGLPRHPAAAQGGPSQAGSIFGVGLDAPPWAKPLPRHPTTGSSPASVSAPASAPLPGPALALGCPRVGLASSRRCGGKAPLPPPHLPWPRGRRGRAVPPTPGRWEGAAGCEVGAEVSARGNGEGTRGSLPGRCRGAAAGCPGPARLAAGPGASRRGWLLGTRRRRSGSTPGLARSRAPALAGIYLPRAPLCLLVFPLAEAEA